MIHMLGFDFDGASLCGDKGWITTTQRIKRITCQDCLTKLKKIKYNPEVEKTLLK